MRAVLSTTDTNFTFSPLLSRALRQLLSLSLSVGSELRFLCLCTAEGALGFVLLYGEVRRTFDYYMVKTLSKS